jgi:hypothetical protein
MPNHPDAIGYLNDLAKDTGEPWFKMICELASTAGTSSLDQRCRETLLALFTKRASYLPLQPETVTIVPPTVTLSADFLETLSGFSNFKLLEPTLELTISKRITLVFGANGSGKSSLCESLKALASAEMPSRPLHNVRILSSGTPGFSYTFRNKGTPESWTPTVGYGLRSATIKYFDTGIAIKNVKSTVEPSRIVVLTPYKLHVFEWAQVMTSEFRSTLRQIQESNGTKLTEGLENVQTAFTKFPGWLLATLDDKTLSGLPDEIKIGEAFNQQELLNEKQTAATQLAKASSEEGLKLLKAEHRELEAFMASVETVLNCTDSLWNLQPAAKKRQLAVNETAQESLVKSLIATKGTLDELIALLRAASSLCNLESPEQEKCPLCRRELEIPEVELFRKYHDLLTDKLEEDIATLRADLNKAQELVKTVHGVNRDSWDKCGTLPADLIEHAKTHSNIVLEGCVLDIEPGNDSKEALNALRALVTENAKILEQKTRAIELATAGRDELLEELEKIRAEIESLEYAQAIALNVGLLRDVQRMAAQAELADNAALLHTTIEEDNGCIENSSPRTGGLRF